MADGSHLVTNQINWRGGGDYFDDLIAFGRNPLKTGDRHIVIFRAIFD